jgi:transposase
MAGMDLTEPQWKLLAPHFPPQEMRSDRRGRPFRDPRDVLNGVLWILRTGAPWKDLPDRYPPYQTCHRRYQTWVQDGTLERVLRALAQDLHERGELDLRECFIDGSFASAKKGGLALGRPSAERAPRSWPLQTALVFLSPFGLQVLRRMK